MNEQIFWADVEDRDGKSVYVIRGSWSRPGRETKFNNNIAEFDVGDSYYSRIDAKKQVRETLAKLRTGNLKVKWIRECNNSGEKA